MTKIYEQLNFFLFISNLCEWHFSCRKSFNKTWSNYPSSLSESEKTTLKNFSKILIKYNKKYKDHLTTEFVQNRLIDWHKLSIRISNSDTNEIKNAFNVFHPRFEYFYARQKRNMAEVAAFLANNLEKTKRCLKKPMQSMEIKKIMLSIY